jgi:RNA polymerase sigma-70 factor (ECF subfamily)
MTGAKYVEVAGCCIYFHFFIYTIFILQIATFDSNTLSNITMTEDQQIIKRIIEGDMQAFKLLIKQNERLVSHMVAKVILIEEDREEICQDVFLKVYDKLGTFNYQSKLSTWIATIAYRMSLNYLQKKKIVVGTDDQELLQQQLDRLATSVTPESKMMDQDMKSYITGLVDHLPIQYRTVITLFHLEEMTYPEIAEITNMPTGTVKNYLFRGRKLLKEKLVSYNQMSIS